MNTLFRIVLQTGPYALLGALIAIPLYYLSYRNAPEPKLQRSLTGYLLIAFGAGALAFVVGAWIGISIACSVENPGNLCGLVGVFGSGPLLAAVAILLSVHFWARNARRVPGQ